ncbi:MAG: hypothetical protein CMO74_13745 [Verrucomicrobiales bacterium]|nr:hypothetical protein [Verrucomicrobiales bacterium]|tara:strand:- start:85225 stop:85545 length:321 start_codon:yes stop_codon:yes gene_type:complete
MSKNKNKNIALIDEKWEVIGHSMNISNEACSRLFNEVLIPLSGMQGKLKFATGKSVVDESVDCIENKSVRRTVAEVRDGISGLREIVKDISQSLREQSEKYIRATP